MTKQERIALFYAGMANQPLAASPQQALLAMQGVLAQIEAKYAPEGAAPMTIHDLAFRDVQAYGEGGFAIPLIGYVIFLNANGAVGIRDDWANGAMSLLRDGADGVPFKPVPGWKYRF